MHPTVIKILCATKEHAHTQHILAPPAPHPHTHSPTHRQTHYCPHAHSRSPYSAPLPYVSSPFFALGHKTYLHHFLFVQQESRQSRRFLARTRWLHGVMYRTGVLFMKLGCCKWLMCVHVDCVCVKNVFDDAWLTPQSYPVKNNCNCKFAPAEQCREY